jgi:hypothetical protein
VKVQAIRPQYVEQLPEQLEEGVLYICEEFDLTAHKCCCGCGEDVYNKLSPVKWQLIRMPDGSVSLTPSIGNWNYACRSHYWIERNHVIDAGTMSERAIKAVRERDRRDRDRYIARLPAEGAEETPLGDPKETPKPTVRGKGPVA